MMDILHIPFAKHCNIEYKDDKTLKLEPNKNLLNHIETIHASSQFMLAETQSGLCLQQIFFDLKENVLPVLRSSSVKYKNTTKKMIYAIANIEEKEIFLVRFKKKGKAIITVKVEVRDEDDILVMLGDFTWFITLID